MNKKSVGILYYTDNCLNMSLANACRKYISEAGLPITSVSLKPMDFGRNIYMNLERGKLTMFRQILTGLESMTEDIVFFCEHDCCYSRDHFDFVPEEENVFYYNENNWRVRKDGFAVYYDHDATSQLCAYRKALIVEYRERVRRVELEGFHGNGYEPGTRSIKRGGFSDSTSKRWRSEFPNLDIRHDNNLTASRWSTEGFRDKSTCQNWKESTIWELPGWEDFSIFEKPVVKEDAESFFESIKRNEINNLDNKKEIEVAVEAEVLGEAVKEEILMTFPEAMKEVIAEKKIQKKEWKDKTEYGFLNGKFLTIHKGGKFYNWIVSDADMLGEDFIVYK